MLVFVFSLVQIGTISHEYDNSWLDPVVKELFIDLLVFGQSHTKLFAGDIVEHMVRLAKVADRKHRIVKTSLVFSSILLIILQLLEGDRVVSDPSSLALDVIQRLASESLEALGYVSTLLMIGHCKGRLCLKHGNRVFVWIGPFILIVYLDVIGDH